MSGDAFSLPGIYGDGDEISLHALFIRYAQLLGEFFGEIFDAIRNIAPLFEGNHPITREHISTNEMTKIFEITKLITVEFDGGLHQILSSFVATRNITKEFLEVCNFNLESAASRSITKEYSEISSITISHEGRNGITKEFSASNPITKEILVTTSLW